jgi:long-chain acyl-CoA synthetase
MQGYYKRPDLTSQVLRDGWLFTGDIGRIDQAGYVYITGRIKNVIVPGSGVNVYPEEIEFFINKIKGIKESCVLGVKRLEGSKKGMEDILAIIVPDYEYFIKKLKISQQEDMEKYLKNEIEKLNQNMAEHKRISKTKFRSIEFPKTTTRKIKRFEVKKEMGL